MRAMVLEEVGRPLVEVDVPKPEPGPGQILVRVQSCGVCRTDLHIVDGELEPKRLPLILGHQVVGTVEEGTEGCKTGDRVGIPWLGSTCTECPSCQGGRENLCAEAQFTGFDLDGGYAEYIAVDPSYCVPLPASYDHLTAPPLLCAGLIGYRALRLAGDAKRLGLYGFGSAAHILTQIATSREQQVYAFTRPGDKEGQEFAKSLGAVWAGNSEQSPPEALDAAIIFAPMGHLVPTSLRAVAPGGRVVCAGIHMSDIPAFPYEILWGERSVQSVANLTRADGHEFFELVKSVHVEPQVEVFPLEKANDALGRLRRGALQGSAVLEI